VLHFKS